MRISSNHLTNKGDSAFTQSKEKEFFVCSKKKLGWCKLEIKSLNLINTHKTVVTKTMRNDSCRTKVQSVL